MPLTLNAPDIERRLQSEAQKRGISAADLAVRLLEDHLPTAVSENPAAVAENEAYGNGEWQKAFLGMVSSCAALNLPQLPSQAFERESFHEDERHLNGGSASQPYTVRHG